MNEQLAEAAIKSLERHGVPIVHGDIPGLFWGPSLPELTLNQLVNLACQRDPAFDPGRYAQRSKSIG